MAEWSIAAVLKTVEVQASGGSNPSLSANRETRRKAVFFFCRKPKTSFRVFGERKKTDTKWPGFGVAPPFQGIMSEANTPSLSVTHILKSLYTLALQGLFLFQVMPQVMFFCSYLLTQGSSPLLSVKHFTLCSTYQDRTWIHQAAYLFIDSKHMIGVISYLDLKSEKPPPPGSAGSIFLLMGRGEETSIRLIRPGKYLQMLVILFLCIFGNL
jgi:hypothetical protein